MLLVVSPAKNLDFASPPNIDLYTQPTLLDESAILIERCRQLTPAQLSSLMGISDKLANLNAERFSSYSVPFDQTNAKQAALAFNGDVYAGFDAQSLSKDDWTFAQSHMRILSGLYGLLKPLDLMQPYRLEMGTKLDTQRGKDLYQFWGTLLTEQLNRDLIEQGDNILINLASNEYFKAVKPATLDAMVVNPVFKDWKNGTYKIISFYAKKARGMMARYIIKNRLTSVSQLRQFNVAGYGFDEEQSSPTDYVFTRKLTD